MLITPGHRQSRTNGSLSVPAGLGRPRKKGSSDPCPAHTQEANLSLDTGKAPALTRATAAFTPWRAVRKGDIMKLGSRDRRPGRSAWPFLVALSVAAVLLAGACGSPAVSAPAGLATAAAPAVVVAPVTTAGVQLRWLMAAMPRLPLSGAQVRAHFDAAFLAQVSPAVLNQALQAVASLRLLSIASAS